MRFNTGYSQEHPGGTKWSKMDITLEEIDVQRFLVEHGLDPEVQITSSQAYQLMWLEAERYMLIHQAAEKLVTNEHAATEVGNIRTRQNAILSKIKEKANGGN